MKVLECTKACDFSYKSALLTEGKLTEKTGSADWHARMYKAEHSPIRTIWFWIVLEVPYWVSTHLVRHNVGVTTFVKSQRNDRQSDYDRNKAPQDSPVLHGMFINAQALINVSRKRLCMKASKETREAWEAVRKAVEIIDPQLAGCMVPECKYRNGACPELKPCTDKGTSSDDR